MPDPPSHDAIVELLSLLTFSLAKLQTFQARYPSVLTPEVAISIANLSRLYHAAADYQEYDRQL